MNTTTAPRKITLARVLNGWYSYNSANYEHSYDIHKLDSGQWSVKHDGWAGQTMERTTETVIVENLAAVRAFINATAYA